MDAEMTFAADDEPGAAAGMTHETASLAGSRRPPTLWSAPLAGADEPGRRSVTQWRLRHHGAVGVHSQRLQGRARLLSPAGAGRRKLDRSRESQRPGPTHPGLVGRLQRSRTR